MIRSNTLNGVYTHSRKTRTFTPVFRRKVNTTRNVSHCKPMSLSGFTSQLCFRFASVRAYRRGRQKYETPNVAPNNTDVTLRRTRVYKYIIYYIDLLSMHIPIPFRTSFSEDAVRRYGDPRWISRRKTRSNLIYIEYSIEVCLSIC